MTATTKAIAPCSQAGYDCRLSQLLRRAIDLIDPPRTPAVAGGEQNDGIADGGDGNTACTTDNDIVSSEDTPNKQGHAAPKTTTSPTNDNNVASSSPTSSGNINDIIKSSPTQTTTPTTIYSPAKKKVRFHESLCSANSSEEEDLSSSTAKISAEIDITDTDKSSLFNDADSSSTSGHQHQQHQHHQQQQFANANKKKVRFHESCALPKKIVSAADAIQAYDLLIHAAASLSSSSLSSTTIINGNGAEYHAKDDINSNNMSWKTLQKMADIYRALHVTSCLLIELLPLDLLSDVHASLEQLEGENIEDCIQPNNSSGLQQQQYMIQSMESRQSAAPCPPIQQCKTDEGGDGEPSTTSMSVPNLSPEIVETLLSTSRKCILLLQALERKCAAKTVAQRHPTNANIDTAPSKGDNSGPILHQTTKSSLFYTRGDDIHDYDRSTSDLYENYDWHDDGYLPLPFSWLTTTTTGDSNNTSQEEDASTTGNEESYSSNMLKECLYCQQQSSDPPSSRHQRSAWTRDWIRRERIVSLRLEDYQYHYDAACQDYNCHGADGASKNGDSKGSSEDYNHEVEDEDMMNDADESGIMLDMSPKALAAEEDRLIGIMFPAEVAASSPQSISNGNNPHNNGQQKLHAQSSTKLTRKKRAAKEREKRKQKRLRQKAAHHSRYYDSSGEDSARKVDQSVHVREGFLLLVCDDNESSNSTLFQHLVMHVNGSAEVTNCIRVYARLQPSGILSLEVCTICRRASLENTHDPVQPLPTRVRYLDFIIGAETQCQPYMPNGSSSFHFRLEAVQFLGASSLCQSLEKDHDANEVEEPIGNTSACNDMTLSFSVDEKAGGALVDGFEWVTALSGAANDAIVLKESIRLEWS